MDFKEYKKLKDAGMTRKQIEILEASDSDNNQQPFSHKEWKDFMFSFINLVKYMGPNRFEMMITNFKNYKFGMSSFMDFEDPTGRDGDSEPYLRIQNDRIIYYDPRTSGNSSIIEQCKNNINENLIASILRSIFKSLLSQLGIFTSSVIKGLFGKFQFNPENDEEITKNDALTTRNNVINTTDMLKVKYAVWGRDIIDRIANKSSISINDRSVTWVKKCKPINYKQVRPIGRNVLNANYPWTSPSNPNFDKALEYICRNFGAKILCDSLVKAFEK